MSFGSTDNYAQSQHELANSGGIIAVFIVITIDKR